MQCPIDGTELVMTERQGIEIDYCPKCRGVWLDRGELDKIIERATSYENKLVQQMPAQPPQPGQPQPPAQQPYPQQPPPGQQPRVVVVDDDDYYKVQYDQYGRPYKKKSMWGDIFDIFD